MNAKDNTHETSPLVPVYLVWNGEMLLDAPVQTAWRHIINFPSWQEYSICRHLSGEVGQEGEVVLLKKSEEESTFPPYRARTILLQPPHRVIWKTFPENVEMGGEFYGIVEFRVEELPGYKTRYSYQLLYEFQVPFQTESEVQAFRKVQCENFEALCAIIFPRLKSLVESDR